MSGGLTGSSRLMNIYQNLSRLTPVLRHSSRKPFIHHFSPRNLEPQGSLLQCIRSRSDCSTSLLTPLVCKSHTRLHHHSSAPIQRSMIRALGSSRPTAAQSPTACTSIAGVNRGLNTLLISNRCYSTDTDNMDIPRRHLRQGSTCPPLKNDTLRLYSMRFCPFALRTRLVLSHKNISHETVNVNLVEKPDWFLARNLKGLVPVLEYNDQIVYESAICNEYLDAKYGEMRLTPSDPYVHAVEQMLMDHYTPIARGFYRIALASTVEEKAEAVAKVTEAMSIFEKYLDKRDFFGGASPGMLDFYTYPHIALWEFIEVNHKAISGSDSAGLGEYSFPQDTVPQLSAWLNRMKKVPAVMQNTEPVDHMVKFMQSWTRKQRLDYDAGLTPAANL